METWDAIRARRKVGAYADTEIEEEKLTRILEAGRRSPSSRNEQRWAFVVVRDRDRLAQLAGVWVGATHLVDAAAAICIVAPFSEDMRTNASINYDLGQATMAMQIAATDVGIGTRHASVHDYDLGAEILGLPDDQRLTWLLGLGYPADKPIKPILEPKRRPFNEVVHWETW